MTETYTASKHLHIGVMLEEVQMSDIMGIDILGSLSQAYVQETLVLGAPSSLLSVAPHVTIHYIATTLDPARMIPSVKFVPTATYDTCRRDLDILFIGGPLPSHRPASAQKFIKEAVKETNAILSVCTGGLWLADAGVLEGRKATTNRGGTWSRKGETSGSGVEG